MQATPAKVLEMLSDVITSDVREEKILSYLRRFAGSMRIDEVQRFLRFVTGSSMCSTNSILVTFNNQEGLACRPIAHTCGFTLELSTKYDAYSDFTEEFSLILNNHHGLSWNMDAV